MSETEISTPTNVFRFERWQGLPVVGLDRNQPLRRYLSCRRQILKVRHLDPGVTYHWPGRKVVRGSSVERWIEACSDLFSGDGIRDFWELIWNLSVHTWDFIDKMGKEPWRKPNPGFPFLNPLFWRGARRTRLLFAESKPFINLFPTREPGQFLNWIDTLVRFQYGVGVESVPAGMMALALNAPSESYLLEVDSPDAAGGQPSNNEYGLAMDSRLRGNDNLAEFRGAWRIPFVLGKGWESLDGPIHQIFPEPSVEGLAAQTIVAVALPPSRCHFFLRTQADITCLSEELIHSLEQSLTTCLGQNWGSPVWILAQQVGATSFSPGLPVEMDWPWLGCVRSLLLSITSEAMGESG